MDDAYLALNESVDWEAIERNVVDRIRMLRIIHAKRSSVPDWDAVFTDLVVPNVQLLAHFCANIQIDLASIDDDGDDDV